MDSMKEVPTLRVTTNAAKDDIVEGTRAGVNSCIVQLLPPDPFEEDLEPSQSGSRAAGGVDDNDICVELIVTGDWGTAGDTAVTTGPATAPETALRGRLMHPDAAIPMLPDFANRVIDLVSDEDISMAQLAAVASKDQVLASRLLGLANSAYFAETAEVFTVPAAIDRVGTAAVRNMIMTVCFHSRMQDRNLYGDRGRPLLEHGIGTAYMARLIAEWAGLDGEEASVYGLLHDIGKLVILKAAYEVQRQTGHAVPDEVIEQVMLDSHAQVGAAVLRRWRLPSIVDEPITCHHDWTTATEAPKKAAVTYLANKLSHRYGFGCPAEPVDLLSDPVCAELGIDQAWFEQTDRHAPGLVEVAKKILG